MSNMLLSKLLDIVIRLNLFTSTLEVGHLWWQHWVKVLHSFTFLCDDSVVLLVQARLLVYLLELRYDVGIVTRLQNSPIARLDTDYDAFNLLIMLFRHYVLFVLCCRFLSRILRTGLLQRPVTQVNQVTLVHRRCILMHHRCEVLTCIKAHVSPSFLALNALKDVIFVLQRLEQKLWRDLVSWCFWWLFYV